MAGTTQAEFSIPSALFGARDQGFCDGGPEDRKKREDGCEHCC